LNNDLCAEILNAEKVFWILKAWGDRALVPDRLALVMAVRAPRSFSGRFL